MNCAVRGQAGGNGRSVRIHPHVVSCSPNPRTEDKKKKKAKTGSLGKFRQFRQSENVTKVLCNPTSSSVDCLSSCERPDL